MRIPSKTSSILALGVVGLGYYWQNSIVGKLIHTLRLWLTLPRAPEPNMLLFRTYLVIVILRLLWWLALASIVWLLDRKAFSEITSRDRWRMRHFGAGLGTGVVVMIVIVLSIIFVGDAHVTLSPDTPTAHFLFSFKWMLAEIIGAAGEEILYRGLILAICKRLAGLRIGLVVSASAFVFDHVPNPGAHPIWLIRLGVTGLLLSYSVVRTQSLWWAIGYHAGWNWGSAPLFGAAGSGYIDEGHVLSYTHKGSDLITGGPVGPEGSVFAFLGVAIAAVMLFAMTSQNRKFQAPQGN